MKWLFVCFNWIRGILPGLVLIAIAYYRRPHPVALNETGIRIVTLWENDNGLRLFKEEVWQAIRLLQQKDKIRLKRLIQQVKIVFIGPIVRVALFLPNGKLCVLNPSTIPNESDRYTRIVAIAGTLVHESTHGLLHQKAIPCNRTTRARIELICDRERDKTFEKLQV